MDKMVQKLSPVPWTIPERQKLIPFLLLPRSHSPLLRCSSQSALTTRPFPQSITSTRLSQLAILLKLHSDEFPNLIWVPCVVDLRYALFP